MSEAVRRRKTQHNKKKKGWKGRVVSCRTRLCIRQSVQIELCSLTQSPSAHLTIEMKAAGRGTAACRLLFAPTRHAIPC
ncbi:hypothetical protein BAUCODRAFT_33530 [Baudoinia panamericana UAMH 10762]|uniref:Uncharacterized protein n=1 Tax=Baudoinia panamericana (strain UAMH 10762) TaxID=717646 RepID=M2MHT6_BAUPA|nr:uncharacterized protein BAUCODRAFT_33530 [Baudoinia panamericana UAMH 10762]EMC96191.1 hypothetical protein BAUCODRAFT_33530 [Baudoinia panamericana UAMH 10762]